QGGIEARFASAPVLIVAGLLVGIGTRLGSGCTSGHGVCGVSRLSARSIVATLTFMAAGIATVAAMNALGMEVLR
ncbi:YeeE/YedE family protein, partial [Erythrobacter sp. HI0074]